MGSEENTNMPASALQKCSKVLKSTPAKPTKNKLFPGKAYINFWVDVAAFLTMLVCAVSGVARMHTHHAINHGIHSAGAGLLNMEIVWGLPDYEWLHLHNQTGLIFIALVIMHIAMHWGRTPRGGYALGFLTFVISSVSGVILMFMNRSESATQAALLDGDIFWWLQGHEWQHLHNLISWVFVVLAFVHIVRHRRWIYIIGSRALRPRRALEKKQKPETDA